jgi:hypothetical protein
LVEWHPLTQRAISPWPYTEALADRIRSLKLRPLPPRPKLARGRFLGKAVQVDPIKPVLKAPGIKHSKAKYDELLSNAAFEFNLRR